MTRILAALSWAAFLGGCVVVSLDTMSRSATLPVGAVLMLTASLVTAAVRADGRPPLGWIVGATAAIVAPFVLSAATGDDEVLRTVGGVGLVAAGAAHLVRELRTASRLQTELATRRNVDELTGLPGRDQAVDRLGELIEAQTPTSPAPCAIRIDLDRFTHVNDRLGHHGANFVLGTIGARIGEVAREHGALASRLTGDDFVVVVDAESVTSAIGLAAMLSRAIRQPITVAGQVFEITACLGVAVSPADRWDAAEHLLLHADIAARRAKQGGADTMVVFDDSMYEDLSRRTELEVDLRGAIGRGELQLAYQPIIEIDTGRLTGFEALLRWTREDGSHVSPAEFVPLAEDLGLIGPIGAWAMEHALHDLAAWTEAGLVDVTCAMSVNVSPRQIVEPDCVAMVQRALERSGVAPHRLWIEITESTMLAHPELARATLRDLRALGTSVALDDFGTGYSSLSLLQQFPLHRIKIDRAFVDGIGERAADRALVRTILAMATTLELDVVAEGIENVHQLLTLRDLRCAKGQGFLISRPVARERIGPLVDDLTEFANLPFFRDRDAVRALGMPSGTGDDEDHDGAADRRDADDRNGPAPRTSGHDAPAADERRLATIGVNRFGLRVLPALDVDDAGLDPADAGHAGHDGADDDQRTA